MPLTETITDPERISSLKECLLAIVPEFDKGAKDAARFIYGVPNPEGEVFEGDTCIDTCSFLAGIYADIFTAHQQDTDGQDRIDDDTASKGLIEQAIENDPHKPYFDFIANPNKIIPEGNRHDTLLKIAVGALTNEDEDSARAKYERACRQCRPPHDQQDIARIWQDAKVYAERKQLSQQEQHTSSSFQSEKQTASEADDVQEGKESIQAKRDKFLEGRRFMYYGSIKGGEYYHYDAARGWWHVMTDSALQANIDAFFNYGLSTQELYQITTKVRTKVTDTNSIRPRFNRKPIMGFSNGVLELDTRIFRPHSPDDFLTWQVGYPYSPEAQCPRYNKFIEEISNSEQSRSSFLDDIAAYILFPDCRLDKIFFLIGEGGNGKSVYLRILEALFRNINPHENTSSVTNIQPEDLKEDTKAIMLENSLVNIAYDINPDLRGCEAILKSLSSGDSISGNLKFHDTHFFTPRAKLISSCNSMIKVNDASQALSRRLMFCKFVADFKQNPDINLEAELKKELPGIFNRVYRAYLSLIEKTAKKQAVIISPTIDQSEFISEFTSIANPAAAFWEAVGEDYLSRGEVMKAEVFHDFKTYCTQNSIDISRLGISDRTFHSSFFSYLRELNIPVNNTHRKRNIQTKKQDYYYLFGSKAGETDYTKQKKLQGLLDANEPLELDE